MNGPRLIRLIVSTLILTALLSRVSALARETTSSSRRACGTEASTLRLYVVNEAGASRKYGPREDPGTESMTNDQTNSNHRMTELRTNRFPTLEL